MPAGEYERASKIFRNLVKAAVSRSRLTPLFPSSAIARHGLARWFRSMRIGKLANMQILFQSISLMTIIVVSVKNLIKAAVKDLL